MYCFNFSGSQSIKLAGLIILGVIFNKQIADFLREFRPAEVLGEVGESITNIITTTITDPVTQAGVATGKVVGEAILPINIALAEAKINQEALDLGFSSLAEAEKALDAGSVVIGGTKNVVDFGLIGNVLPTDPSPEFLANPEKFLTPSQLKEFEAQQALGIIPTAPTQQVPVVTKPTSSPSITGSIFDIFANLFGGQTQPKMILTKDAVTDPTRGELRFGG